ncbi:GNAT family N-acetyltransferase [Campylobacter mucosalis]|uniref:(R)-specific enoyl-CoA hydratase n=1 Tax=Campylobacter mucosalis CCUG 21559 TaxID=1032067 RepID=A0A6G5QEC9_9BACT|nr:GNAT family N-acetyltransferase [Campylobacter mucosalis]QCD44011.1 (R)-specific enoyl-CoA hydratase [Campylobacter mucosalis CCUG 21559]
MENFIDFDDIKIGMTSSYSQTITDADIKAFAGISGDRNPVHLDEEYAKNSRFKKRIAHGMLTASFFSAIFGTKIPGEGCVYTHQSLNFKKPVYVDDTVVATIEVIDIDKSNRRVRFKTICKTDKGIVTDGEAEIFVPLEFKKYIITDKRELLNFKDQIFLLFKDCFNQDIDDKLWQWAYIDNPNGDPIVSLYFDRDKLVGHYAIIPVYFSYNNKSLKAGLSMTTMVDTLYRKYGIFAQQANMVYDTAHKLGYSFVYGFPNKNSAPGFKKRLDWTINENLHIANLNYDELNALNLNNKKNNTIIFDVGNEANLKWRLSKPLQTYFYQGDNILKKFNNEFDIVFANDNFDKLEKNAIYNILISSDISPLKECYKTYYFGYKIFDNSLKNIEIKKDLLMSDVF